MSSLLKTYLPSQIIFREGLPGSSTYVVRQGKVEISVMREGRKVVLATLGEGALFGEMAPFDGGLRSATASAATSCEVWCVRTEGFREMVDACPPFIKTMVDSLVGRIRRLNGKILSSANPESWLACAHVIDLLARYQTDLVKSDTAIVPLPLVLERLPEILSLSESDVALVLRDMERHKLLTLIDDEPARIVVPQFRSFLSRVRVALRLAAGSPSESKEAVP